MSNYTVPTTGTYREADGSPSFYWTAGTVIPLSQAVAFDMPGAAAQQARELAIARRDKLATYGDVSNEPAAYSDFRNAANGVPVVADSGQTWQITGTNSLEIISGKLTNLGANDPGAGYAVLDLGDTVSHIGARFTLGTHTTDDGAAALVIWDRLMGGQIPNSPMHLTIGYASMTIGYWTEGVPGTLTVLESSIFGSDLIADKEYVIDVYIRGDVAEVTLSNGATMSVTDSHISTLAGNFACWEVYAENTSTDAKAKFVEVWADTLAQSGSADRSRGLTKYDMEREIVRPVAAVYVSDTDITIPTTAGIIHADLTLTTTFPDSGKLLCSISGWFTNASGSWVVVYIGSVYNRLTSVAETEQQFRVESIVTGTPGDSVSIPFQSWRVAGTAASFILDIAQGQRLVTSAIPLDE